jgi:tetratricopeptide (TPR) repeat protein
MNEDLSPPTAGNSSARFARSTMGDSFVGRERELAELRAGLDSVIAGHGRLFLVSGEPGIGKSRLAEEVSREATEHGMHVLWGRCWDGGGAPVYWPVIQILRACANRPDFAQTLEALGGRVAQIASLVPEAVPMVQSRERDTGSEQIDPERARFHLFDAVATLLNGLAAHKAMVVVFDDLHAADHAALQMLCFLARALKDAPVLLIGTHRETEVECSPELRSAISDLAREGCQLPLSGLNQIETAELVRARTGAVPEEQSVATLHRTTAGNPLFLNGVVQMLVSEGKLERHQPLTAADLKLPTNVRGAIQARLDRISRQATAILAVAAALGNEFHLELLQHIAGSPIHEVLERLDEAARSALIGSIADSPGRYRFEHALIRDAIYDAIGSAERVSLHRRIAEELEKFYAGNIDAHLQELAYHYLAAILSGTTEKAIDYAIRAGDAAYSAFAFHEALAHWKTALRLADSSGASPLCRASILYRLGDWPLVPGPQAVNYLEAAAAIYEAAGDYRRTAEVQIRLGLYLSGPATGVRNPMRAQEHLSKAKSYVAELPDSDVAREFYVVTAQACAWEESIAEGIAAARRAMESCARMRDPVRWASSAAVLGSLLVAGGSVAEGIELVDLAGSGSDGLDDTLVGLRVATLGGFCHLGLCDPREAQKWFARELERPRNVESPRSRSILHGHMASACWTAGDLEEARRHRVEAGVAADEPGWDLAEKTLVESFNRAMSTCDRMNQVRSALQLGPSYRVRGEPLRASQYVKHYLSVAIAEGNVKLELAARQEMALIDADTGAFPDATSNLERCREILAEGEDWRGLVGLVARAEAVVAGARGKLNDAEQQFERANVVFRRYCLPWLEAETFSFWGRALGSAGEYQRANEKFDAAIEIYLRIGAGQLWIDRVQAEMMRTTRPTDLVPHRDRAAASEVASSTLTAACSFRREAEYWTVAYEGTTSRLKDSKGLAYIAHLLRHPATEFHVVELANLIGGGEVVPPPPRDEMWDMKTSAGLGDAGAMLDPAAKAAYKRRLHELREELEEAREFNDPGRAEKAQEEIEFLTRELTRAVGLSGRDRKAASHAERSRVKVTKAIRVALSHIADASPALGRHLEVTIKTGEFCVYTPDPRSLIPWQL